MTRDLFDPPAIVRPAEDLATLARQIDAEHQAGEAATRKGLAHFRAAGEKLLRAKAQCEHGKWLPWLEANVRFDRRTATNYMNLARIPADKWETVSHLGLRDVLRLQAGVEPTDPAEVRISGTVEGDALVLTFNYSLAGVKLTATGCEVFGELSHRAFGWLLMHMIYLNLAIPAKLPEPDREATRKELNRMFWKLLKVAKAAHPADAGEGTGGDGEPGAEADFGLAEDESRTETETANNHAEER
jgi:hypothetical protein